MSIIQKIKDFFKQEEIKEVVESPKTEEIDSWLKKKKEEIQKSLIEKTDVLFEELSTILNQIEKDAEVVANINIQEKKVDERIKNINESGRKDYLSDLNKLIENLRERKQGMEEINHMTSELYKFLKNSQKSYFYATQVIGDEMKKVKDGIIKIEKLDVDFKEINSKLIEKDNKIKELIIKNKKRHENEKSKKEIMEQIDKIKKVLEERNTALDLVNKKIKDIKLSSDFLKKQELLDDKVNKEKTQKALESSIQLLIDKKSLEKYVYLKLDETKNKIAKDYIKNPIEALLADEKLELLKVIEDVKEKIRDESITFKEPDKAIKNISIKKDLLEEYRNNLEKAITEIKELEKESSFIIINLEEPLNKKTEIEKEIDEAENHINSLNKRLEKSTTTISNLENELTSIF